jgi:protein TonB
MRARHAAVALHRILILGLALACCLAERGRAAEDPPSPALLAHYGETIADALGRYREYPRSAQVWRWQGVVTVRLQVAPSGRLLDAQIRTSSGHEVLDREAIAMAWRPERLPPLPEGVRDQEVTVLVPIVFRLTP